MRDGTEVAVVVGRLLGLLVIIVAIAMGAWVASEASSDSFWAFLATAITPVGIGFLILMVTEVINQKSSQ